MARRHDGSSAGLIPATSWRSADQCTARKMPKKHSSAGTIAYSTMRAYGTPVYWLMMKAIDPITGGMMTPPVEAAASTAPANCAGYPMRFIIGMVRVPVVRTLAGALPEMVPVIALAMTETLAGPPRKRPATL